MEFASTVNNKIKSIHSTNRTNNANTTAAIVVPSSKSALGMDFEALLSRQYTQPAYITRLIPREKYVPPANLHLTASTAATKHNQSQNGVVAATSIEKQQPAIIDPYDNHTNGLANNIHLRSKMDDASRQIVLDLITHTRAYQRHDPTVVASSPNGMDASLFRAALDHRTLNQTNHKLFDKTSGSRNPAIIESKFHEIELGDWESNIVWDAAETSRSGHKNRSTNVTSITDASDPKNFVRDNNSGSHIVARNDTTTKDNTSTKSTKAFNPLSLLERPRNHLLDTLEFDHTTVIWDGNPLLLQKMARQVPLILEYGVAGQSVARHVYQNIALGAQRPTPALKSDAYRNRLDRDWSQNITSTADLSPTAAAALGISATGKTGGSLRMNKDHEARIIAARQKKRAQMAEDKTTRVAEAMGTMSIGGGRGRTVTSSLMGPGGTERTGRPSRSITTGIHETEYVEQLDMIDNHSLVRNDWSKILLRQYMRPKLPMSVVRDGLTWQLQIRYIPTNGKSSSDGAVQTSTSYHSIMIGTHAGSISKERLRTEADLSPTEGKLVLLEYVEERPPIQVSKGMCSKIINYYRDSDKTRCPVSAGGGDRPARRKRGGNEAGTGPDSNNSKSSIKLDRLPRLDGPNRKTTITDWVGTVPKKSSKDRSEQEAIDVLPEGVTETLHPKVHGPFIGGVDEGTTLTGLINNLFVAPMFIHEPESTDFLMILTPPGGASRPGQRESMGVILREIPTSMYTVGQIEPRVRVNAPNSQGEKAFINPFVSFQIARVLNRTQVREGHGLRFDEIQDRVLPTYGLPANSLRQRLKQVAMFDKTTQIWTTKQIGFEEYIGVDELAKSIAPEGVAVFESANAAHRRLSDLGIDQLADKGAHTVVSVGVTMVYLAGQLNAAREYSRKVKKLCELSKTNKTFQAMQIKFYEKASEELELYFKTLKQKYEVAQFIYEELQLAPWHLTGEYHDVHKKGEGTGMMKLTGLGDPSGLGEGFSFIREADAKPIKSVGVGLLNGPDLKKITGTEDDLRKLTMKQMAALLRSYGMAQKQIDTLKRWDRVHVIRDLSTKAASDGIGDGLCVVHRFCCCISYSPFLTLFCVVFLICSSNSERFARGEKMKLSEQKEIYSERIKVIWKRQIVALSAPGDRSLEVTGGDGEVMDTDVAVTGTDVAAKSGEAEKEDTDDDTDDDDFAAALEDEMVDRTEANQLVVAHARGGESEGGLGQIRTATQDQDLTKDARELAALKRQREEERVAKEGLKARPVVESLVPNVFPSDRKVIRRRITKTHPDGRQTTTFKFILHPEEVGRIMARLQQEPDENRERSMNMKYEHGIDEKPPSHAMFEDEDDFEFSSRGRLPGGRRKGGNRRSGSSGRSVSRARNLQISKLKTKQSTEERMRKRKKEEDELDVYVSSAKRKGTNNRRERGSIRDRRAHVVFSDKLEAIRQEVESRPSSGPFLKPVRCRRYAGHKL
jgi:Protein of unknown function (DUF3591)